MTEGMPIETAPKDGTEIKLLIEHENLKYCSAKDIPLWRAEVDGKWIEHNGGGWTWYGLSGTPVAWKPQPPKEF